MNLMRHKTISMLALTLVLALAAGTALLAQDTTTATGKITNVDTSAGTITVSTAGGGSETFSTDAQSMYMSDGRTINLRTLKNGDQVTVTYRTSGNTRTATHVDVVSTGTTGTTTKPPATSYDSETYGSNTNTNMDTETNAYDRNDTGTMDSNLPRTGSALPLIGLASALFGGAALTLMVLRRLA
jgi:Cu/Ag efflux protein CusF